MPFLTWIGKIIVTFGLEKLVGLLTSLVTKYKRNQQIKAQAKESMKPINAAKTKEEINEATRSALDGF